MKRGWLSWWLGIGLNTFGSAIIITDLLSWLEDGDGFSTSSLVTAVVMILIGSWLTTFKPVKIEPVDLDLSDVDFDYRLIYKEHDGKLWRYISVHGKDLEGTHGSVTRRQGASSTTEIKPGSAEWLEYYTKKETDA